jgi:hypothetical protein
MQEKETADQDQCYLGTKIKQSFLPLSLLSTTPTFPQGQSTIMSLIVALCLFLVPGVLSQEHKDTCSVPSSAIPMNWTHMSGTGSTTFSYSALVNSSSYGQAQDPNKPSLVYLFGGYDAANYNRFSTMYKVDLLGNTVQYVTGETAPGFPGNSTSPAARNSAICGRTSMEFCGCMVAVHHLM